MARLFDVVALRWSTLADSDDRAHAHRKAGNGWVEMIRMFRLVEVSPRSSFSWLNLVERWFSYVQLANDELP